MYSNLKTNGRHYNHIVPTWQQKKSVWWISDNSPEPNGHVKLIYLSAKKNSRSILHHRLWFIYKGWTFAFPSKNIFLKMVIDD